jgi:hypothetical protein
MRLFRPTENTKFHIDYAWFEKNGQDVKVLIFKCLTPEQQERFADSQTSELYDYIDVMTAEVTQVDPVLHTIRTQNVNDPNFITSRTPVAEAAFRVFLVNNNQPLTPLEMAARMNRRPAEILAQLGSRAVYNGIRPVAE